MSATLIPPVLAPTPWHLKERPHHWDLRDRNRDIICTIYKTPRADEDVQVIERRTAHTLAAAATLHGEAAAVAEQLKALAGVSHLNVPEWQAKLAYLAGRLHGACLVAEGGVR